MGDSMTAISLGQTAHHSRLSRKAITAAIKFGQLTNDSGGYSVGPAQVREQFEVGNDIQDINFRGTNAASPRMTGAPAEEKIDEPTGKFLRPGSDIAYFKLLAYLSRAN